MIETNRIEFKERLTDGMEKEVVAFLNYKEGGHLYIGIADNGAPVGIADIDAVQLKIKDRLKTNILPSCLGLFDVIHEVHDGKDIINVNIASGTDKPYYLRKNGMSERGCYIRIGAASEPMPVRMIEDLFARQTRNSLNKIRANRQDLSFAQLKIYYHEAGFNLTDEFAVNLELLTKSNEYNYVAYLMSDNNGNSIKVAKYAGTDRVDLIESNEYGYCSLIKATKQVLAKLELENKTATQITSKERIDTPLWNPIAIREAVINAIVHNDYSYEAVPKFEIFTDRLEITSAGGLISGLDQEEFFEGYSIPRNKEIMRIFKDLELVEYLGTGIPRILKVYPRECFKFTDNFLRMSFPRSAVQIEKLGGQIGGPIGGQIGGPIGGPIGGAINLTSRQNQILSIIRENNKISYRTLAVELEINDSAVKKHLKALKNKGVLERIGGTRGHWKINEEKLKQ